MNNELLKLRQRVLLDLQRTRATFVLAGDRVVVDFLDESIAKMKQRVAWAAGSEARKHRFSTPENAQFATGDNRPDNGPTARGN